jgi:hypothetical protein
MEIAWAGCFVETASAGLIARVSQQARNCCHSLPVDSSRALSNT